jgi:hypothetical protein
MYLPLFAVSEDLPNKKLYGVKNIVNYTVESTFT